MALSDAAHMIGRVKRARRLMGASPLKGYELALEKFRIISLIISYASISA